MKSVLHLTYLHFAAGAWQRWLLLPGLAIVTACLFYPPTTDRWTYLPAVAFVGVTALFLGSTLMPVVMYRLSRSHVSCVLPFGRAKLLASALLTTALVSLLPAILIVLTMRATFPNYSQLSLLDFMQSQIFAQIYAVEFLLCSWLYLIFYLLGDYGRTQSRSPGAIWAVVALIAMSMLPRYVFRVDSVKPNPTLFALIVTSWAAFSLYTLYWPSLRDLWLRFASFVANRIAQLRARIGIWPSSTNGRETDVVLGMGNRWFGLLIVLAFIALDAQGIERNINGRPYYFSLFTVLAGVSAGIAPTMSRSLWLRRAWSRDELFAKIERIVWRRLMLSFLALLIWFATTGVLGALPLAHVTAQVALIALLAAMCLYLGLLQTRGSRWSDALVGFVIIVPALVMAAYASRPTAEVGYMVAFELVFLTLLVAIRHWAKHRWHNLDWMLCRAQRLAR